MSARRRRGVGGMYMSGCHGGGTGCGSCVFI
jgi:hypothetical protein